MITVSKGNSAGANQMAEEWADKVWMRGRPVLMPISFSVHDGCTKTVMHSGTELGYRDRSAQISGVLFK